MKFGRQTPAAMERMTMNISPNLRESSKMVGEILSGSSEL